MSLKFKRNIPLMLWLIAIVVTLATIIGNYPIIAYTFN
jgi:hypothetical protein